MHITFLGNFGVSYSSETHHAASIESLGHTVTRLQEGNATGEEVLVAALSSQLLVVVHTHGWTTPGLALEKVLLRVEAAGIPTATYHLDLWLGLHRQADLDRDPFYRAIQHFFSADKLMADWFNTNTDVQGHYLPAAVYDRECYISPEPSPHANDVIFVGSRRYHPEWPYRPKLIDWLAQSYGKHFTHIGGDGATGTIRGDDLNRLYAGSKVAVGDTLCLGFDYPHYFSDRVFETLGRGGFMIHPWIEGIDEMFEDGTHLVTYPFGDLEQLQFLIDYYLADANVVERERIRHAGHEHVKAHHTYRHRWQTILSIIFEELPS